MHRFLHPAFASGLMLFSASFSVMLAADAPLPRIPAKKPAETLQSFHVLHGFQMELLASEPLVTDPVAMAYDEDGRAYVAEMRDYPYTDKANHKPSQENPTDQPIGRIRLLTDTDGDGRFDKSTLFAEGLSWPTGVACWKGGVFVAATPDLWYFKDTDGDGKADVRERWFTGFRKLNVQAVMNGLQWGLDNRIHGAGGSNGGVIESLKDSTTKPQRMARNDFAFQPDDGHLELLFGGARYGLAFDDWGNRFLCNIRNPAQHVVLPAEAISRNPFLIAGNPVHDVAEAGDQLPVYRTSLPEPWREVRAKRWTAEAKVMPRSELVSAGVVTSSSGITVYRGSAYPAEYQGQIFVADVAGNLFYRLKRTPEGVTFRAVRADDKVDFVTSEDIWFRPVNFVNAPDGTLHVLDMYRETIEHPWSIPDDLHALLDLESGRDRGRIYRLAPPAFVAPKPPRLSVANTAELVATLENPNAWWCETAQRLLFERRDPSAAPALKQLLRTSQKPLARLHALWTLQGLQALTEADVLHALNDPVAGVREHAVKLSLHWLQTPGNKSALTAAVLARAEDPDARVRFQTAFALGLIHEPPAATTLVSLAANYPADTWLQIACLSSLTNHYASVAQRLLEPDAKLAAFLITTNGQSFLKQTGRAVGALGADKGLQAAMQKQLPFPFALGLGEGARLRRLTLAQTLPPGVLGPLMNRAETVAMDARLTLPDRLAALELLTYTRVGPEQLQQLLAYTQPSEVQVAALRQLLAQAAPNEFVSILNRWPTLSPVLRNELLTQFSARADRALVLLEVIAAGKIPAGQLSASRRNALLAHRDLKVQERARAVLGETNAAPRSEVVEKLKAALSLTGNRQRGAQVYQTACAVCHKLGEEGKDVGPNLATVRTWTAEQLLTNILDPNREVAPSFVAYSIELRNGETRDGIIVTETGNTVTLRRADGGEETLLRAEIERVNSGGLSLMPEGLEASLTPQAVADLIELLRNPNP